MDLLRRALWPLRSPEARIRDAEQRFFDAYNRGGAFQHRQLVLPLDTFTRPQVIEPVRSWLTDGGELNVRLLERALDPPASRDEQKALHENLATFLWLLSDPLALRVSWTEPDGRLLSYGSDVFE